MKKIFQYGMTLVLVSCVANGSQSDFPCVNCKENLIHVDTSECNAISKNHEEFMIDILEKETQLEEQIKSVKQTHNKVQDLKEENIILEKEIRVLKKHINLLLAENKNLKNEKYN